MYTTHNYMNDVQQNNVIGCSIFSRVE